MEDFLNCPLCYEKFDLVRRRPKVLECGHTFCLDCLLENSNRNGMFCPTDRKKFTESPESLKDNYYLFPLLDSTAAPLNRRKFWCVECSAEATSHCEEHHDICNINKVRARQVQDACKTLGGQLRREIAVLQDLANQLQGLQEAVVSSLQVEAVACAAARQRALNELGAIPDTVSGDVKEDVCQKIADAVSRSTDRASYFDVKVRMLSLARKCAVAAERSPDVVQVPVQERDRALAFLSYVLLGHRDLKLIPQDAPPAGQATSTRQRGPEDPTLRLPDHMLQAVFQCLRKNDLVTAGQVCRRWRHLSRSDALWRHRELGVFASGRERAYVRVLRTAPCLARLNVVDIGRSKSGEHQPLKQQVLLSTCKVRALHVSFSRTVDRAWSLQVLRKHAPQLEEVVISNANRASLQAVESLAAGLKGLWLWCCDKDLSEKPFKFPALPRGRSTLQWLYVYEFPEETLCSLLRAHRHTLQRLKLPASAIQKTGVDPVLRLFETTCELASLRDLRLDRWRQPHMDDRCVSQLEALRRILPAVSVRCSVCPSKPIPGRRHTVHGHLGDPASTASSFVSAFDVIRTALM